MNREPGAKAQLTAALIALVTYGLNKYLGLLPEAMDLLAPIIAYGAAQLVGWLWARQQTTPVTSPTLPVGTTVTTVDHAGRKSTTTL